MASYICNFLYLASFSLYVLRLVGTVAYISSLPIVFWLLNRILMYSYVLMFSCWLKVSFTSLPHGQRAAHTWQLASIKMNKWESKRWWTRLKPESFCNCISKMTPHYLGITYHIDYGLFVFFITVALICIALMIDDVEYLFTYVLVIHIFSLVKYPLTLLPI